MSLNPAKPFKEYEELVDRLIANGMIVDDSERSQRKLSQVGYYRLSGFWHPCRQIEHDENGQAVLQHGKPKRLDLFKQNTKFEEIFKLYIFDKKLRLLLLDAI